MLNKWRGWLRLVFSYVMLFEVGLNLAHGVGGKVYAHMGMGCMV